MKEYECVRVDLYKDISKTIEEYQKKGWRLHTYTCARATVGDVNHYLLFEREAGS